MSEKEKPKELSKNAEEVARRVREIQDRHVAERKELEAMKRSLKAFAEKHEAEYFCTILIPDIEAKARGGKFRYTIFKFGSAGEEIAKATRDLPYFTAK